MNEPKADASKPIEILIAEDSPTQAEQLKHFLVARGYTVTVAQNGKEALAAALQSKPALVITDVLMPEMDGYTLCKEIKSLPTLRDLPVILLTSLSRPQDVLRGLECGADNFIRKPYDEKYLLSRVDYILVNLELRKTGRMEVGVQLYFAGQKHFITAEKQQILDLLISTYEGAVRLNDELEKKQKELEAANQELEAFSSSVSHDLRAPLRHINAHATLLMETCAAQLEPEAQDSLKLIKDSSKSMSQMVDDLLKLARLEQQQLALETTDLNVLVEESRHDLEGDLLGRQIEWRVGKLPAVACDPGLMKSAFANLLSNAAKYTRRHNRAIIEVGQMTLAADTVIFVRDNGAGFDSRHASKLFGVFQRFHREEEFEGTGVGLATVQRIIHKHGGRIWAEAEVDKGATFFFTVGSEQSRGTASPPFPLE